MYGLWILVIIFGIISLLGIGLIILSKIVEWKSKYKWFYRNSDEIKFAGCLITFIFLVICAIFVIIAICSPIVADTEYREFETTRLIVEQSIENGSDTDNYAITQTIINANKWYIEVKVSKEKYGNWSMYYKIDLDDLKPISLYDPNIIKVPPIA